jgi:hypothetical protein
LLAATPGLALALVAVRIGLRMESEEVARLGMVTQADQLTRSEIVLETVRGRTIAQVMPRAVVRESEVVCETVRGSETVRGIETVCAMPVVIGIATAIDLGALMCDETVTETVPGTGACGHPTAALLTAAAVLATLSMQVATDIEPLMHRQVRRRVCLSVDSLLPPSSPHTLMLSFSRSLARA